MLIHVVMFNFKSNISEQKKEEVLAEARKTLTAIPGVMNLMAGKKLEKWTSLNMPSL